jgi:hypothetical protein
LDDFRNFEVQISAKNQALATFFRGPWRGPRVVRERKSSDFNMLCYKGEGEDNPLRGLSMLAEVVRSMVLFSG